MFPASSTHSTDLIILVDCWQSPHELIRQNSDHSVDAEDWTHLNKQHNEFYSWLSKELDRTRPNKFTIAHNYQSLPTTRILGHYPQLPQEVNYEPYNHVYLAGCHLNRCLERNSRQLWAKGIDNSIVLNWSQQLPGDVVTLHQGYNYVWFNVPSTIGFIQTHNGNGVVINGQVVEDGEDLENGATT